MEKFLKIIGVLFLVLIIISSSVYFLFLQYPALKENPTIDKWYRVTDTQMKSSDGSQYKAFFKKGSENKVIVYFAGGGVSVSTETAKEYDMYNTNVSPIDYFGNLFMNMGGIASALDGNPFKDWTVIAFPYATGDFHTGTNELKYVDKNGIEQILYHYGYINYNLVMKQVLELAGIDNPESVLVTGYSAGGFGASLLADDIFTNYFPNANSKTVLVDSSLLLNENWQSIATNVWKAPTEISDRLTSDNITLDSLTELHKKFGSDINILFDSSTRDGDLAKVQNFFDTDVLEVDESKADIYQQILKDNISQFKNQAGAYLFIWDGLPWYDDPRDLTMHTIIATSYCFANLGDTEMSISQWAFNAVNGDLKDYGIHLLESK